MWGHPGGCIVGSGGFSGYDKEGSARWFLPTTTLLRCPSSLQCPLPPDLTCRYLGFDVENDPDLLYIAEWALTAPVPEGWTVHLDGEGQEFFHNAASAVSMYEHPMDEHYKQYYQKKREEKRGGTPPKPDSAKMRATAIRV